jgi:hypothetical protein
MPEAKPVAVVELPEFILATRKMLDDEEREELIDFLAYNPTAGDVIAGTGGVRKVRWALPGGGKSGGARIIYFFHDRENPLIAISAFKKNEMENISHADRNDLKRLTSAIKAQFER